MKSLYALTPAEHATVLAALCIYQRELNLNGGAVPQDVEAIASNAETVDPLTDVEIDAMYEGLNRTGLTFGEVVNMLGEGDENPYVAGARNHDLLQDGLVEVDTKTVVSKGDDGAYVMAWLRVSDEPAGVEPDEEDSDENP